jgi:hypothetical protein
MVYGIQICITYKILIVTVREEQQGPIIGPTRFLALRPTRHAGNKTS